jgi:hypothetical protein
MSETQTRPEKSVAFALLMWLCVFSPLLLLITFLSLAAHVRLALGHWPTPMTEGFGGAGYGAHERVVVWFGNFTVFLSLPLWLLMLCFRAFRFTLKHHLIQFGVYAVSWGLIALYIVCDPGRFVAWFID